jgi:hypothetical protein
MTNDRASMPGKMHVMDVDQAIADAERLLPGTPVEQGVDPRWQAIIEISQFVDTDPEPVWLFIARWGNHNQEDLRTAVATVLLEHLLEYHFDAYFPRVEQLVLADKLFANMFCSCWKFGQSEWPDNAKRFDSLLARCSQTSSPPHGKAVD